MIPSITSLAIASGLFLTPSVDYTDPRGCNEDLYAINSLTGEVYHGIEEVILSREANQLTLEYSNGNTDYLLANKTRLFCGKREIRF